MPEVEVELLQDGSRATEGVDERLLALAKKHQAVICTLDYNLNKVAVVEGIMVLNINELAQALRMAHLPGEELMIEVVQKGQDSHQGVGYLPDGTMVVVEQANKLIGQTVRVEIVRSLQTAAGKMMFAKRVGVKPVPTQAAAVLKAAVSSTGGRKQAKTTQRQKSTEPEKHGQQNRRTNDTPKRASQRRAYHAHPKRQSRNREDALLDLVNSQQ